MKAHKHLYDIHPTLPTMVACAVCGFTVPAEALKSKVNLDAFTARKNATSAALVRIELAGRS